MVLLLTASLIADAVAKAEADAVVALLLLGPGLVSAYVVRPGEHGRVSGFLRGPRSLVGVSGLTAFFAAALVVLLDDRCALGWGLWALGVVAAGCFTGLHWTYRDSSEWEASLRIDEGSSSHGS